MGILPDFGAFVLRAEEKDGRTCINGLPVASPSKQMLGRFPLLQDLRHPNLCAYLHFSETIIARDLVIIAVEYLSTTLGDILKTEKMEFDKKFKLARQILSAVEFLHSRSIAHGLLTVETVRSVGEGQIKLMQYGLPFLTNKGKDASSTVGANVYLAPERIVQNTGMFATATYLTDVWDLGMVFLQLYLGIQLSDIITEDDFLVILNQNHRNNEEAVFVDILKSVREKLPSIEYTKSEWVEEMLTRCLQIQRETRISVLELAKIFNEKFKSEEEETNDFLYELKTIKEMREAVRREVAVGKTGFEKLSIENTFHLWKICGSTPEMILLKKGFIQNHAPISSYPGIRYDDFLQMDSTMDNQSTFNIGTILLPNKRIMARVEPGHKVSAAMFHQLETFEDKTNENILYETSSNILTVEHLLNATAVAPLSKIIPRLLEVGVLSTQRADVWRTLLNVGEVKWKEFLNLDILAPHSSDRQLEVDIPRCHQYDSFMTTPAVQESLRKILKGWQIVTEKDNYVYWQGCDSLATPFLLANINKPHIAFACFKEFTYRYCHKFYLKDNSEVIKEYLTVFYHLVAYVDPVLYKHLKNNGFDAELFAIPWFLTCFAHELPLSKLVLLWDETVMHDSAFPLMIALAMLNRLRDKLLAVNFNEMIIIIHDQPDLSIEDVIKNARIYEKMIPPSCTFRMHASPWKAEFTDEIYRLPNSMTGLPLLELSALHCPRMSSEELVWRVERKMIYVIDTRPNPEFQTEHFVDSHNHPDINNADIDWLRVLPGIVTSLYPKCIIFGKHDKEAAARLAEGYVMKGVPYISLCADVYDTICKNDIILIKK